MNPAYSSTSQTSYPVQNGNMQLPSNLPSQQANFSAPTNTYVTPTMWQEVVANSLMDGRKRTWDYSDNMPMGNMIKRQR